MQKAMFLLAASVGALYYNGLACWKGTNTDTACSSCDYVNKRCTTCSGAYVNPKLSSCQRPALYIPACVYYATSKRCLGCEAGYSLNSRGLCRRSQLGAATLNPDGSILYCADRRYYPDENGNCTTKRCVINNCSACNSTGLCGYCRPGHTLYRGYCPDSRLVSYFNNCASATYSNQCDLCNGGYYVNGGMCYAKGTTPSSNSFLDTTPVVSTI